MTFVCFALLTLVTEKGVLKLSPIIVEFFPHIISPNFCSMYFGIILLGANTFVFIQLPINRPFYNYEKKIPALSLAILPAFLSAFSNSNIVTAAFDAFCIVYISIILLSDFVSLYLKLCPFKWPKAMF